MDEPRLQQQQQVYKNITIDYTVIWEELKTKEGLKEPQLFQSLYPYIIVLKPHAYPIFRVYRKICDLHNALTYPIIDETTIYKLKDIYQYHILNLEKREDFEFIFNSDCRLMHANDVVVWAMSEGHQKIQSWMEEINPPSEGV